MWALPTKQYHEVEVGKSQIHVFGLCLRQIYCSTSITCHRYESREGEKIYGFVRDFVLFSVAQPVDSVEFKVFLVSMVF
jgi:hypothetical protein